MAWNVVQSASHNQTTQSATCAVTYGSNVSAGNKLIALVTLSSGTHTITSVKDAALNSFTLIEAVTIPGPSGQVAIYALDVPAGDVGTTPTLTATINSVTGQWSMVVQEVSGLATGNTLAAMIDGTAASKTGSATGATGSPTYSTTAASEYLVCCQGDDGGPMSGSITGYTVDANSLNNNSAANANFAYKNSTSGAETGSWTLSGTATGWVVLLAAFKIAPAGSTLPSACMIRQAINRASTY